MCEHPPAVLILHLHCVSYARCPCGGFSRVLSRSVSFLHSVATFSLGPLSLCLRGFLSDVTSATHCAQCEDCLVTAVVWTIIAITSTDSKRQKRTESVSTASVRPRDSANNPAVKDDCIRTRTFSVRDWWRACHCLSEQSMSCVHLFNCRWHGSLWVMSHTLLDGTVLKKNNFRNAECGRATQNTSTVT